MLPDEALSRPLMQISTRHEARKPLQAKKFIDRTVAHIGDLGGELDEVTTELVEQCLTASTNGQLLTSEQSSTLEASLMRAYRDVLASKLGIPEPTVKDALKVIFERAGVKPEVFTYTEEQKRAIDSQNAQIAVRNLARGIGGLGLMAQ